MGNKGKHLGHRPLKGSTIRSILANNPSIKDDEHQASPSQGSASVQATASVPNVGNLITLCSHAEYDTLNPENNIKTFASFAKNVVTRYEENDRVIAVCDKETQDVLHYIELHDNLNAWQGFVVYKKLREIRRKRRQCKNEIDLLAPVYQFFKTDHADLLQKLGAVQGKCKTLKAGIDTRQYTLRTGVMDSQ